MKFSVLMSIYSKEKPEYFNDAMRSLWDEQILKPDEIVLVEDGPLGEELRTVIELWRGKLGKFLTIVPLKNNCGLGIALNEGLKICKYDWVARFDTDDINHPERFSRQISYLKLNPSVKILGSSIQEFSDAPDVIVATRNVPRGHLNIIRYSRSRNPFNHMTVVYNKQVVIECGGYKSEYLYEDYCLWMRILHSGAESDNLQDFLVKARVGNGMYKRRGGGKYALQELKVQIDFYRKGYISLGRLFANVLQRIPIRLMPQTWREFLYIKVARRSADFTSNH